MKASLLPVFAMASVMAAAEAAELAKQDKKQRQYTAPDGGIRVVVVPVGNEAGRSEYESRIEFRSSDGKIACALDYSSRTPWPESRLSVEIISRRRGINAENLGGIRVQ